jgi:hypothetical protein
VRRSVSLVEKREQTDSERRTLQDDKTWDEGERRPGRLPDLQNVRQLSDAADEGGENRHPKVDMGPALRVERNDEEDKVSFSRASFDGKRTYRLTRPALRSKNAASVNPTSPSAMRGNEARRSCWTASRLMSG